MKKMALALCALTLVFAWPVQAKPVYVTASQNYITQEVTGLAPFTALSVSGQAEVDFRQGAEKEPFAVIYGSDNLVNLVEVKSDGKTLTVHYKDPLIIMGQRRLKVTVVAPSLERVEVRQSGEVDVQGLLTTTGLSLSADGEGEISFRSVNATNVTAQVSGDASIDFDSLACQTLNADARDTASFESERTTCDAVTLNASDRAEASVGGFSGRTVTAAASNNAEVDLKGTALTADLRASGSSELEADDLRADTVNATVSDSARMKVQAVQTLNADASKRATIVYKGYPDTINRHGKEGNIRQHFDYDYDD